MKIQLSRPMMLVFGFLFCFALLTSAQYDGEVTMSIRDDSAGNQSSNPGNANPVHPVVHNLDGDEPRAAAVIRSEPEVLNVLDHMREQESMLGEPPVQPYRSHLQQQHQQQQQQVTKCNYVFSVPGGAQCSHTVVQAKVAELQQAFRGFQTVLEGQQTRLDETESFVRRINRAMETNRLFLETESSADGQSHSYQGSQQPEPSPHLSDELDLMADGFHRQLVAFRSRVKQLEAERARLAESNINLTERLNNASSVIRGLNVANRRLAQRVEVVTFDLGSARRDVAGLSKLHRLLTSQKQSLEGSKLLLTQRVDDLSHENARVRDNIRLQREEIEKLLGDKDVSEKLLRNASRKIRQMETTLQLINRNNGSTVFTTPPPCIQPRPTVTEAEVEPRNDQDYSQCGRIVSVSRPETVREDLAPPRRKGVWMKDPLAAPGKDKVWLIRHNNLRLQRVVQFASMRKFRQDTLEAVRRLRRPLESIGAVVYNGSLYSQRKKTNKIVRYNMRTGRTLRMKTIKNAGFGPMFAYSSGVYSAIDFAADESGMWVIYSTVRNKGNITISKVDPVTLRLTKTVNTKILKSSVANAFIICGTLYTVSNHKRPVARINHAVELSTGKTYEPNIAFYNKYRMNVMIDYNPRDRYLYAWDNGRQVRYKVTLDTRFGPIRNQRDQLNGRPQLNT